MKFILDQLLKFGVFLNKVTKINVIYAAKAGAWLSLGQLVSGISGFVLTFFLVKFLEKTEYGVYVYILSIIGILSSLSLSGLETLVTKSVAQGDDATFNEATRLKTLWSLPGSAIALSMAGYYFFQENLALTYSLLIITIYIPIINGFTLYTAYLNGKRDFKTLAFESSAKNILLAIFVLGAAMYSSNPVFLIFVYAGVSIVITGIFHSQISKHIRTRASGRSVSLAYGFHLSFMNFLSVFSNYIDRILIFQVIGSTSLAHYALAYTPVRQILSLSKMVGTIALPHFSMRAVDELKRSIHRKVLFLLFISSILFIVYFFSIPYIFLYFFPDYADSILLTQILSIGILCIPLNLYMQALIAHQRKHELYLIHIFKAAIKIVLTVCLIPWLGVWGAVYAFLITHILSNLLGLLLFHFRF